MTYNNPKAACGTYQDNELTSLTPVQIVARLYLALEHDLVFAKKAIALGERAAMGEKLGHALAIIGELQTGLNFEEGGEITANLYSLYLYITTEISKANLKCDSGALDNAINTVKPLAEAWSELAYPQKERIGQRMGARPMAAGAVAFHATF